MPKKKKPAKRKPRRVSPGALPKGTRLPHGYELVVRKRRKRTSKKK